MAIGIQKASTSNNLFVSCLSGQHLDRLIIRNNKIVYRISK
jgi:hypothetical protein